MDNIKENIGDIIIYQTEDGLTKINVKLDNDTVWLNQQQMSELFQSSRTNIVEHIKHIYEEGELTQLVGISDRFAKKAIERLVGKFLFITSI